MRECRDCKVALEEIRVLDATETGNWGSEGQSHVDLSYAPVSAQQSWFTGTIDGKLPITGMICPRCRRIELFG